MDGLFGGIEGGGTKFVCVAGSGPDDIRAETVVPTTTPAETLGAVVAFFEEVDADVGSLDGVGIASFGPLDVDPRSATYGHTTKTPKRGWGGIDLIAPFRNAFAVPIAVDTDVNGAALAEGLWGAARGLRNFVYLTVGTGIGGGAVIDGVPLVGRSHPEMGHLIVPRHPDDPFPGRCPYHGPCLEGMAAGPAIEGRWGRDPGDLGELAAGAVQVEAHYLGLALVNIALTLAPQRIIVGGGVMALPGLLVAVRAVFAEEGARYPDPGPVGNDPGYITSPGLGSRSGVLGALELGRRAAQKPAAGRG